MLQQRRRDASCVAFSPLEAGCVRVAVGCGAGADAARGGTLSCGVEVLDLRAGASDARGEWVSRGLTPTPTGVSKLVWSPMVGPAKDYTDGLLVGAMEGDKRLHVWNSARLGRSEALVATTGKQACLITSIDCNVKLPHVIASGGDETSPTPFTVWDLNRLDAPQLYAPREHPSLAGVATTCVAFNRQVPHIIAFAAPNTTTMWCYDMKMQRPVISIQHQFGAHTVLWSPDSSTIIATVGSGPMIQIWDLRNVLRPLKELQDGHTADITCAAWSSSGLATGDSTGRTLLWDPRADNQVRELHPMTGEEGTGNGVCALAWSPHVPGALVACHAGGGMHLHEADGPLDRKLLDVPGEEEHVRQAVIDSVRAAEERARDAAIGGGGGVVELPQVSTNAAPVEVALPDATTTAAAPAPLVEGEPAPAASLELAEARAQVAAAEARWREEEARHAVTQARVDEMRVELATVYASLAAAEERAREEARQHAASERLMQQALSDLRAGRSDTSRSIE